MTTYATYYDTFALDALAAVHAPITRDNRDALVAWIAGEAGWSGTNVAVRGNNPLNIKLYSFLSYGIATDGARYITNSQDGTQAYGTFTSAKRGASATARYLQLGRGHGYDRIITALMQGSTPLAVLDAIARSDWAASHYGIFAGHNSLHDNLVYVRAAAHPMPIVKESAAVKFIPYAGDPASLPAIEVPKGTPICDLLGNKWDEIDADTHLRKVGNGDAHAAAPAVLINTARYYADDVARQTVQIVVFRD